MPKTARIKTTDLIVVGLLNNAVPLFLLRVVISSLLKILINGSDDEIKGLLD
jgi:hypothetical protein